MSVMLKSGGIGYRLDDEQRDRIRDCLTKEQIALGLDSYRRLVRDVEASVDHFHRAVALDPLENKIGANGAFWAAG